MSTSTGHKASPAAIGTASECCSDPNCSAMRNRYFFGKRMSPESYRLEQRYGLERRLLLNRAIHGWGVVYGLGVTATSADTLTITPGLALDRNGRELLQGAAQTIGPQKKPQTFHLDNLLLLDGAYKRIAPDSVEDAFAKINTKTECVLLSIHYAELDIDPVSVKGDCNCDSEEFDHTCETVIYSLRRASKEDLCRDLACQLRCTCGKGLDPEAQHDCGEHRCICEHLTKLDIEDGGMLCEIEDACGRRLRVDLRDGVPLACVEMQVDGCDRIRFGESVDACGPRKLVKRNDVLFDLIQGCDLTRIKRLGWHILHRERIPFTQFSSALAGAGDKQAMYVSKDFWVEFTQPVSKDSLRADCFSMTVLTREREGGWWQPLRVPILRLEYLAEKADPVGHVRGAALVFDGAWIEDAVRGRRSIFQEGIVRVEIEVRGDYIIDCNGQAVDANAVGLSTTRTGNGTAGGTFLSTFSVVAEGETSYAAA